MKQINKANQLLSEKIGGAKGTEIDEQFQYMEKKTDIISRLIEDVRDRTNEYLQPNPASRAKLWTVNNLSKMRGQVKNTPYPQPEGTLGETMIKYGKDLGDESQFGCGLIDLGESLRQMAGIKYALEDNIKQNFLDPLSQLKDNDIREVLALRKKTESRRLDYDCKKRKKSQGTAITEEELNQASEKFEESKRMTEQAMNRMLTNDVEHVTHLLGFAEGLLEYHNQCYEILKDITKQLNDRKRKLGGIGGPVNGQYGSRSNDLAKMNGHHNNNNNNHYGGSLKSNSDTSSGGSRFYDNGGADTTSSVSENNNNNNFFPDNRNIPRQQQQPQKKTSPSSSSQNVNQAASSSSRTTNGGGGGQMCRALYDFEAENDEELDFKEGDIIRLVSRLDENWLQGEFNGRQGRFPVTYVQIN